MPTFEVQARPTSRRRYTAGPQPARDLLRVWQRVVRRQLLPGRSLYPIFLGADRAGTPLLFYTNKKLKNIAIFCLQGLSQVCTFSFSQTHAFVRPSISSVHLLFLQRYINRNGDQESAIKQQRSVSVWLCAYGGLDTLKSALYYCSLMLLPPLL